MSRFPFEVICWCGALLILYFTGNAEGPHFSLCPFAWLNIPCPGCGLGRSLYLVMHGELRASVSMHWLGIPAFLILVYRIIQLFRNFRLTLRVS